jgi:hypothetical protein
MKPRRTAAGIAARAIVLVAVTATFAAACSSGGGSSSSTQANGVWPGNPGVSPGSSSALATDAAGLGIYDGKFGSAGIELAAKWLGAPSTIRYAQDFIDATDWSHIGDPWQLDNWKGTPYQMVWGVPMMPCGTPGTECATDTQRYDDVAAGGANNYFQSLAQKLVSAGFGSSYIRLGWEFNASWMSWGICNQDGSGLTSWAKDFVPAYRQIVTTMRSVSGANFKFIWNPVVGSNVSCPGGNLENFYPGDKYVDVVALDVYDGISQQTSNSARMTDLMNGTAGDQPSAVTPSTINGQAFKGYGLDWLAAFGKEHGKLVGIPEWGLESPDQQNGGGDDAYFITQMADWIKANATGPAIFWNHGPGTLPLDIPDYTNGGTPAATAAFKAAFGTGS